MIFAKKIFKSQLPQESQLKVLQLKTLTWNSPTKLSIHHSFKLHGTEVEKNLFLYSSHFCYYKIEVPSELSNKDKTRTQQQELQGFAPITVNSILKNSLVFKNNVNSLTSNWVHLNLETSVNSSNSNNEGHLRTLMSQYITNCKQKRKCKFCNEERCQIKSQYTNI